MLKIDWNILFNIINVFVLYLLMKKFLFGPVTSIIEKRTKSIETSLENADNKNNEALKLKQEYEKALKDAEMKATDIIKEARQRALEEHEKQLKAAKEEAAIMMDEANKSIELERKLSLQRIQTEIAGIAIAAAAKLIQKNMDEGTNKQIINDFLAEEGAGK